MRALPTTAKSALGIAFVCFGLAATFVILRLTGPFDGTALDPWRAYAEPDGVVVIRIADDPAGLADGDVVIAIAGHSLEEWADSIGRFAALEPRPLKGAEIAYEVRRAGTPVTLDVSTGAFPIRSAIERNWGVLILTSAFLAAGFFVFSRKPAEPVAAALLILSAALAANVVAWSSSQVLDLTDWRRFLLYQTLQLGGYILFLGAVMHFALVFPSPGRLVTARPNLVPAAYVLPFTIFAGWLVVSSVHADSSLSWFGQLDDAHTLITIAAFLGALGAFALGYRTSRNRQTRIQFRWVTFAFGASIALATGLAFIPLLFGRRNVLDWNLLALTAIVVPLAIAVSILRYQLFDIDLIISRTLVWGTLTAAVFGIYLAVVGLASAYLLRGHQVLAAVVATALVALIFQPLRTAIQRRVDRLIYGERDEPFLVVSRLTQRVQEAVTADGVLAAIAETVAGALKLPYVEIRLFSDTEPVIAAVGTPAGELVDLGLSYQNESIGTMRIAPRTPGEQFSPADRALLEELARHVSAAAQAVRLSEDLQHSRQRIVTAREEERRRLRRDLHDGLAPSLAGLSLKLEAARTILPTDPQAADAILEHVNAQTRDAIASIRQTVYGLRPPSLDELGLVSALGERAGAFTAPAGGMALPAATLPRIEIEAPDPLPSLPAATEVAAFWIASEAMANVVRHARATHCLVRVGIDDDQFTIEVIDNGIGMPEYARPGIGQLSMRERAREVGGVVEIEAGQLGGLVVRAALPRT